MRESLAVCLVLAAGLSARASAATYRLCQGGRLSLGDDIVLRATAYAKGWSGLALEAEGYDSPDVRTGLVRWQFKKGAEKFGSGTTTALTLADGRVYVRMAVTMERDFPTEGLVVSASIPEGLVRGGAFSDAHGKAGVFPEKRGELFIYSGTPQSFSFELPKVSRRLTLDIPASAYLQVQDDRTWGATFSLRLRMADGNLLAAGKTYETAFFLGGEKAELSFSNAYVIRADENWIPLDYRKEIVPGSAADFSHFPFRDGPAGKHGWLKAKEGQFVFEDCPDDPQRFWGVNLCFEATCPSHADADRIVASMERAGYNTMRIHHYEKTLVKGSDDRLTPNPEALDNFDYLFAKAKERGIYTTTDIYVSRAVHWRDVGIDRDGEIGSSALVKGLFLVHEPAFENWKAFARNLFTHVNPYTGLRYADDPAMPFVVLVNEGNFAWCYGIFNLDVTREAWKAWLAEKRAKDPDFCPKAPADCLGRSINDRDSWDNGLRAFCGEMEERFVRRAIPYLRSLGVKAMLTDWNCSGYPSASLTNAFDYVDTHYYVNHPVFLGDNWGLPSRVGNSNPNEATREMGVWMGRTAWQANKPYTISEWNFTGPNSCRGAVGLLAGGCAARLDWDALWRFDYIGSGRDLDDGTTGLGYFGIVADPFKVASDRAGVLLFRRRELQPIEIKSVDDYVFPLATEKGTGRFTVVSEATAGGFGFAEDVVSAGPLVCRLGHSHATIWASALDDKSLVSSDRILLTHLTDLKTDGMRFSDETCKVLLGWGSKSLIVRRGTAEVSLALDEPAAYDVWALETNGARKEKVAVRVKDGRLDFVADVRGEDGRARYLYEIVRR